MAGDFQPIVGLFREKHEARAAVRGLIHEGFPRFNISVFDPDDAPGPRRGLSFLIGALFGALETAGLVMAARVQPSLANFFRGDWTTAALAGAVLGAIGGGFIGFVLASTLQPSGQTRDPMIPVEGTWPSGLLVSVISDPSESPRVQTLMARFGAANLTSAPSEAPKPPAPAFTEQNGELVDFLGRPASIPPVPMETETSATTTPVERRHLFRRSTDRPAERRGSADRRQQTR